MFIKGINKFREKLPAFSGKKIILLPIFAIVCITFAVSILLFFDILPTSISSIGNWAFIRPGLPIIGGLLLEILGLFLVFQMWFWRDRFKKKFGKLAYQRIFFSGFMGVIFIIVNAFHPIIRFEIFYQGYPESILNYLIYPITSFMPKVYPILVVIQIIFGVLIILGGFLMLLHALVDFGFDYMTVVYLYYPEESQIKNNEIYSMLRHPTYSGAIMICIGATITHLTIYSFVFLAICIIGFAIHIQFVEEKELIQRFGESYIEYRKKVHAFFVQPSKWGSFLKYLISFSKNK